MDANRFTAAEMLARLVSFDTVSRNSNLTLIEFVKAYLAAHGVKSHRVPNTAGNKANLWATIGPVERAGVVLSGHTDVVPVDGQAWSSDPFVLGERNGRLYGRGAADMKGFLAIALSLVPEMVGAKLQRPIHLALSYDEEVGCLGAPSMIAELASQTLVEAVIVGEPTMMRVSTGHKGVLGLRTHVHGFEVHSSLIETGVSAIHVAARLINWHDTQMAENRARTNGRPEYALYGSPYTTLHCGVIEGGTAHNITARDCIFTSDIRALPDEDPGQYVEQYRAFAATLVGEMRAVQPLTDIEITQVSNAPGCRREAHAAAEQLARHLTGDNAEHVVDFGTEAGQFQVAGLSTVVCGPGDIAQAHQADEYLSLEQLAAGVEFQWRLIRRQATV